MTIQSIYRHESPTIPDVVVAYPERDAPFVLQSCYTFGAHETVERAHKINAASAAIFDALRCQDLSKESAAHVAVDLVDTLVCDMGFTRIATGCN